MKSINEIQPYHENSSEKKSLCVVGMGGSAGAFEAFGQFLSNMPSDSNMAFIILQHLDPTHKSLLPELIQRKTNMKVFEITDGMELEPNCVYVVPPRFDLSIKKGILKLTEPPSNRLWMPIDFFFSQLAEDQEDKSICIIFSGMGTDGTQGLKEIKDKLGTVLVQDPETAEFKSMPLSAIDTNIVDCISTPWEMPSKLLNIHNHSIKSLNKETDDIDKEHTRALQRIVSIIRNQTGHDFSMYKVSTLFRRIERRMGILLIDTLNSYIGYLEQKPEEIENLFNELLIGVTNFFREPEAFEFIKNNIIPNLLNSRMEDRILRIWIPGCSTGEEVYSIAIIIMECLEKLKEVNGFKINIFASDISSQSIGIARQGIYPANIAANVSPERLDRYFNKLSDSQYQIKKFIREMVVFAHHNVIMDPPFIKLDLLCCRNLLIYFTAELQKKLFPLFHYSLNTEGILFLGSSESIGEHNGLFSVVDNRLKIYRRKELVQSQSPLFECLSPMIDQENLKSNIIRKSKATAVQDIFKRILEKDYNPPAVMIDESGDIIYISGKTGKYLEPSPGRANLNIFNMAREEIRFELGKAVKETYSKKDTVTINLFNIKSESGFYSTRITARHFSIAGYPSGMLMVIFEDVTELAGSFNSVLIATRTMDETAAVADLEDQLSYTREHLQSSIEEMETSQEELKSMNEELQMTNEELQSSNEELKTSREELQALNEELVSVNAELQNNNEDLIRAVSDLKNLVSGAKLAAIFLDNDLNIMRFTPEITTVIHLIKTDIGRPIGDIVQKLKYKNLISDIREVLDTLEKREIKVQSSDENWYNMRIFPYRTIGNLIGGIVITFNEIQE